MSVESESSTEGIAEDTEVRSGCGVCWSAREPLKLLAHDASAINDRLNKRAGLLSCRLASMGAVLGCCKYIPQAVGDITPVQRVLHRISMLNDQRACPTITCPIISDGPTLWKQWNVCRSTLFVQLSLSARWLLITKYY